jgi:Chaperone of endosialidase
LPRKSFAPPALKYLGSIKALTRGNGGSQSFDANGTMAMTIMSDARAKRNITFIGRHPLGFGLYLFRYKPAFQGALGAGRHFGVLAQEVERVAPHAVCRGSDGFRRVDYGALGIHVPS